MNKHFEKIRNGLFDDKISEEIPESIIIDALLKGEKVVIPDFGYLEPKSLSGRQTVLFKSAGAQDSLMKQLVAESDKKDKNHLPVLYDAISTPLKEGKEVSFPRLGVFQPLKKEDGSFRVSFTLSSVLRKQLSGGGKPEVETAATLVVPKKEDIPVEIIKEPVVEETKIEPVKEPEIVEKPKIEAVKEWKEPEKTIPVKPVAEVKRQSAPVRKIAQKGDIIVPQDNKKKKADKKNIVGMMLALVAFIAVVIVLTSILFQNKKEEQVDPEQPATGINLPALAEQHYGNSIFWVYIYDANQKKLTSPINIPAGVELVIPDLSEYNVDVTDSMEIRRAMLKSDLILNQKY
ncbi:MAG: hypothetical protein LBO74_17095 [Candidatus Symbiothrix sp.]|jgi:nucleoid DNA-binding protein|nr:hypothetical protein [Candidatus Symbiothrix sp.]